MAPYVEPYYNSYAAPYVEKGRPYVDTLNARVYTPAFQYGKQYYERYGAPRVDQARVYGQDQWDKIIKPQIDTAQSQVKQRYESNLAPHVSKASSAAAPYITTSRNRASQLYDDHIIPSYEAFQPYATRTYSIGRNFAVETGLPYVASAWSTTTVFLDRTLWPKVRILYGENVEPQLVRIRERLGRYRDGKKLKAAMDETDSSTTSSSISTSFSSVASSVKPDAVSSTGAITESIAQTASSSLTPEQEIAKNREQIENDLKNWEDRFTKAADKGIEDLEERVKEITDRQVQSQVHGVGEALVIQLDETASSEISKLKKEILHQIKKFPEEYDDDDLGKASLSLSRSTRFAGMAIKDKGQALRSWKEAYDQETQSLVSAATASTLDVIDNIRDLGLQEIGLRWAQMEGVTYKDWSRYNEVKKTFDVWRSKVEAVAQGHEGLRKSKAASEELESRGMAAAEETASELARLRDVGKWKLEAGDLSDDFSTRKVPAKAAAGAQQVMGEASSVSEQVVGTSTGGVERAISDASEEAAGAASSASSIIIGTGPGIAEKAGSHATEAASIVSEKAEEASEKVVGGSTPVHKSVASEASDSASSIASAISGAISGSSTPLTESASSRASSVGVSASSVVSEASKKVYGGAMAQAVGEQKPVLDDVITDDDDATYSEKLQDMVNQAGNKYSDVTKAVSDALLKATSTQGTMESASSIANEQYSKALEAASSVLYGTQTGAVESATSAAADRYAQAVAA